VLRRSALTLVGLLVVIAIVSVLASILAPSLHRARYLAKLAVCASNLHEIASGANTYAGDHRGFYPDRAGVPLGTKCNFLAGPGRGDDRPILRQYMPINGMLNCPMTGRVDLEDASPTANVYATYDLWFGWRIWADGGGRGLTHMDQQLEWLHRSFDVLACDRDIYNPGGAWVHGTHPDAGRVTWNEVRQNQPVLNVASSVKFTLSRWISYQTNARGPVDRNFAHADGSVRLVRDVVVDDPRMVPLPEFAGGRFDWAVSQLPPAD